MSDTSARASRFAFWLGSFARNGFIGAFDGVGVATSGRGPPDAESAAAVGRSGGRGAGTGWLGASGAEGRAGEPKGVSGTLAGFAGAAAVGCRGTSISGRLGGLAGAGAGGCTPAVADAGATLVVAAGGMLRGSTAEACGAGTGGGDAIDPAGGVGRRPGANGGTRAGVEVRGATLGGATAALDSAITGRSPGVGFDAGRAPTDVPVRVPAVRLAASWGVAKSSVQLRAVVIGMIPPHTEQRARTPGPGTRAGSTRNTVWHSGHETFMTRRLG